MTTEAIKDLIEARKIINQAGYNTENIRIEDYSENPKSYSEIKIPKGYRLLTMSEVVDFCNSKQFKIDRNRCEQFFFQQPFKKNLKLGYKVAVLYSYNFDDRFLVTAVSNELVDIRYSFGVFIKK